MSGQRTMQKKQIELSWLLLASAMCCNERCGMAVVAGMTSWLTWIDEHGRGKLMKDDQWMTAWKSINKF